MTTDARLRSRVLRRELHSSKSGLAITLAVLAILALAWLATECVLSAAGQRALALSPADMAAGIRGLPSVQSGVLIAAGAVLAVIGIVLVIASLTSGRRGRHIIEAGDTAAVVNDEVIGSALVRSAAAAAGISPDRAVASVGKRTAVVRITPISGVTTDHGAIDAAVSAEAASFDLSPSIRTRIRVDKRGKVGG